MILMEDRSLSSSPFSVSIRKGWVLWKNLGNIPVEEVWIVSKRLGMDSVIVENQGSCVSETSTETSQDEVDAPGIGEPASHIEVLDGQFSNEEETKKASDLCSCSIVSPVKV